MKSSLLLFTAAILTFTSCRKVTGEGPVINETRNITNFSAISIHLSGQVFYKQDTAWHVEIRAQRNILDLIETPVSTNELKFYFKNNIYVGRREDVVIIISAPAVNSFDLSGSADLHTSGTLTPADCNIQVSGSGNVFMEHLVTNNLEATVSGSGDILVSGGSANHQTLKISGSGSVDLLNVTAKSANSNTSGSGTIKVNLTDRLDARISGSGKVYYRGTPQVSASISGSGKVVAL